MFRILIIFFLTASSMLTLKQYAFSISLFAIAENQAEKNITSTQAKKLIEENKNNPDFIILDVRTPGEYSSGHIENALNIDYKSDNFKEDVSKLDKNNVYVVYCGSGRRAGASIDILEQLGFKNVYNIGGVVQWQEAGFKLTEPESK